MSSPLSVSARSSTATANGVVVGDGAEASLVPAALLAETVNLYGVPLVRPRISQVYGPVVQVQVGPPPTVVTVNDVAGLASGEAGLHEMMTD